MELISYNVAHLTFHASSLLRQGDDQMMGYEGQGKPGGPGGLMGEILGNMMSQNANKVS